MNSTKDVVENPGVRVKETSEVFSTTFHRMRCSSPPLECSRVGEITDECSPKQTSRRFHCIRCQILEFVPDASVHSVPYSG